MHTFSETGSGVPAFLAKLWRLVEDSETNNLIYWSKDGRSFVIQNQAQFARDLLPLNYKHNNMASFIRQLNMYGFHKITSIDNGGLKFDRDEMEFTHPYFKRGCPYLLEHIKRKIAHTKQQNADEKNGSVKTESVNKVLTEVKAMRGRQESLDNRFSVMKQENEALWREIATLRQKHIKQQQIVNKLIQFLVTIVQPSRNMSGVKRHFQLMINDAPHSSKMRKASESESGPIIHELTEELLDEVAEADADLLESTSPNIVGGFDVEPTNSPNIDRPQSNMSVSSNVYDNSNQSGGGGDDAGQYAENSPHTIYDISEIPEYFETTATSGDQQLCGEENVLNTPLVKQEMARNQQLQQHLLQQQKQLLMEQKQQQQRIRRKRPANASTSATASTVGRDLKTNVNQSSVRIKTENDMDPLIFLDVASPADTSGNQNIDPALASPNSNAASQAISSTFINVANATETENLTNNQQQNNNENKQQNDKHLFNTGDFITTEMPSDIFEETDNFATNIDLSKIDTASGTSGNENDPTDPKTLAVTKYKNNQKNIPTDETLRFDDVTSHLDNVQDDLDNLKDLLRGEGYSLDTNTLMGNCNNNSSNRIYLSSPLDNDMLAKLFNDTDILNPYGLSSLPNENLQDNKKGSELMTYQPYYSDFSDILDMNAKTLDFEDNSNKSPEVLNSTLNTPHPERE